MATKGPEKSPFMWTLRIEDGCTTDRLMHGSRVIARVHQYPDDTVCWHYLGPYKTVQRWSEPGWEQTKSAAMIAVMILALNDAELRKELFGPKARAEPQTQEKTTKCR